MDVVDHLEVSSGKTRIAAVQFGNSSKVAFGLDTYSHKQDVMMHLKALMYQRTTGADTAAALRDMVYVTPSPIMNGFVCMPVLLKYS